MDRFQCPLHYWGLKFLKNLHCHLLFAVAVAGGREKGRAEAKAAPERVGVVCNASKGSNSRVFHVSKRGKNAIY